MRECFSKVVIDIAINDTKVILLTGDVEHRMTEFKNKFMDRFFNLGLCEQTIIGIAAGMASEGLRPIVYSITPFILERPFEQVKIEIDEQNLPVILIGYSDYPHHGPTHRCLNEKKLISIFKNIQGYFPENSIEAEKAIRDAYNSKKPSIICLKKDKK